MPHITMYSTRICPYCRNAEQLLRARGITDIEKIAIDTDPEQFEAMMARTGRRTVPQIFIGERHIGGFDDLAALDSTGELTRLLSA